MHEDDSYEEILHLPLTEGFLTELVTEKENFWHVLALWSLNSHLDSDSILILEIDFLLERNVGVKCPKVGDWFFSIIDAGFSLPKSEKFLSCTLVSSAVERIAVAIRGFTTRLKSSESSRLLFNGFGVALPANSFLEEL